MKNIFKINRKNVFKTLSSTFIVVLLFSCGGGGGGSSNTPTTTVVVSGQVTYDRVPVTDNGLDYLNVEQKPVRRAYVVALDSSNGDILESVYTDNLGNYTIDVPAPKSVKISVYSVSQLPTIKVQDNFTFEDGQFAVYTMESAEFTTVVGENVTKNLNADSGYNSSTGKLGKNDRVAAPFAILDTCLLSADFFLANRAVTFPTLTVNWSKSNSSNSIETSHWDGTALYILGDADVDTDEYDQHVIVHEWGHYFEAMVGRSDSVGGTHSVGDVIDPRVAFSEGWGNALSAMVLYPDYIYKDTGGLDQGSLSNLVDVGTNNIEQVDDPTLKIGWFSESSVQAILYDLFDPSADDADESWDLVSVNSGDIYDVFSDDCKNSESLVTIFTFINGYLIRNPSEAANISALLAKHGIEPIIDEFGSAEINDAGVLTALPIYKTLAIDSEIVLDFESAASSNKLANIQYIKISGVSGIASITATGGGLVEKIIYLEYKGIIVAGAPFEDESGVGTLSISGFDFDAAKTYILVVNNGDGAAASQITITLTTGN